MEGISDIRIVGIDETRPPKIHKEPYIDLFFRLSHKAPPAWCTEFNDSLAKHPFTPKIKPELGLYIETWVRKPDEVPVHLKFLKAKVAECSARYIEKLRLASEKAQSEGDALKHGLGEQGRLNSIIAELDFDAPPDGEK